MKILRVAVVVVALTLLTGAAATSCEGQLAQPLSARPQQQTPLRPGNELPPIGTAEPLSPEMESQQLRSRNSERQKKLVADTDKLLSLATELKQDVAKTNKDVMSLDVIKKADEIEKLAHNVKERMKG